MPTNVFSIGSLNCFWASRQLIELDFEIYEGVESLVGYIVKSRIFYCFLLYDEYIPNWFFYVFKLQITQFLIAHSLCLKNR